MIKFTFLTKEQIFDNKLSVIKTCGTKCVVTDLNILLGGASKVDCDYKKLDKTFGLMIGSWLTSSKTNKSFVSVVGQNGKSYFGFPNMRGYVARPSFNYSELDNNSIVKIKDLNSSVSSFAFGSYPQTALPIKLSKELEEHYDKKDGYIKLTGNFYTFDSSKFSFGNKEFEARRFAELKDPQGNRYIRFAVDYNCMSEVLPSYKMTPETLKRGEVVWILVEPIVWLLDKNSDIVLSEKALFSGIRFDSKEKYNVDFECTEIYNYMNNYFSKEMLSNIDLVQENNLFMNIKQKNKKM